LKDRDDISLLLEGKKYHAIKARHYLRQREKEDKEIERLRCHSGYVNGSRVANVHPAVLRIRDVYPGSRIVIYTHPGSRILDPGSKNNKKREG
jgi:hypothetical protein